MTSRLSDTNCRRCCVAVFRGRHCTHTDTHTHTQKKKEISGKRAFAVYSLFKITFVCVLLCVFFFFFNFTVCFSPLSFFFFH